MVLIQIIETFHLMDDPEILRFHNYHILTVHNTPLLVEIQKAQRKRCRDEIWSSVKKHDPGMIMFIFRNRRIDFDLYTVLCLNPMQQIHLFLSNPSLYILRFCLLTMIRLACVYGRMDLRFRIKGE